MAFRTFLRRSPNKIIPALVLAAILILAYFRSNLSVALVISSTPIRWNHGSSGFLISEERDNFDVTFANYSESQQTALPDYPDLAPPILHHIALGHGQQREGWLDARQSCLQLHADWESHLWTDLNAHQFVQEHFPNLKEMWENYKYPIQRVDALRYMVLYEYGGMCSSPPVAQRPSTVR